MSGSVGVSRLSTRCDGRSSGLDDPQSLHQGLAAHADERGDLSPREAVDVVQDARAEIPATLDGRELRTSSCHVGRCSFDGRAPHLGLRAAPAPGRSGGRGRLFGSTRGRTPAPFCLALSGCLGHAT